MGNKKSLVLVIIAIGVLCSANCKTKALSVKWETEKLLSTPECVVFDPSTDFIFVSNINGSPTDKDGNGFISKVDLTGKIVELRWFTGIDAPKGIFIKDRTLYFTDITKIIAVNIDTKVIEKTIDIPDAKFLNDIIVTKEGLIVTTDTNGSCIFTIKDDIVTRKSFILNGANGLFYDGKNVFIGANNNINKYDTVADKIEVVLKNIGNIDGLVKISETTFFVSNFFNKLLMIDNGKITTLISGKPFIDCIADFCILEDGSIIVPTFGKSIINYSK